MHKDLDLPSTLNGEHPITGSSHHLCLFDRLHEKNVKKEEEILRRVTFVHELNGILNTQREEQLNLAYKKDSSFLNQMLPLNHIFLLRSNIDIRNERINEKTISFLEATSSFKVTYDRYGRALIDKNERVKKRTKNQMTHKGPLQSTKDMIEKSSSEGKEKNEDIYSKSPSITNCTDAPENATNETKEKNFETKAQMSVNIKQPLDDYWIRSFDLRYKDKTIIEEGYWINDRIINAAMSLMRSTNPTVNGLNDTVIGEHYGFVPSTDNERFLQIINVRKSHWITMSNVESALCETFIYNSLLSLNKKRNNDNSERMSYPLVIEQAICQIRRPPANLDLCVLDVQQQNGGNDCGLFAIAFALALCQGKDPTKMELDQSLMRTVLVSCLEAKDIDSYLTLSGKRDTNRKLIVVDEWGLRVYCHCKMPDDGSPMVKCKKCKNWFHQSCESGNFQDPEWLCIVCDRKKKLSDQWEKKEKVKIDKEKAERSKIFVQLREASEKHNDSTKLILIYNKINELILDNALSSGTKSIGCLSSDEYKDITSDNREIFGATVYDTYISDMFIGILNEKHNTDVGIFETVIHEVVHACHILGDTGGTTHGKEFKVIGEKIISTLREKQKFLPMPFCKFNICENRILKACISDG